MTLNDIRKKSGLLLLVIGAGMLGFIFMDLMNSGTSLFQKEQNTVLEIDGQKLTFTNFLFQLSFSLTTLRQLTVLTAPVRHKKMKK